MASRYELFSSAISSIYHDIQRIERTEMARFGLKGPHAQCLVALNRYPEGITAARLCEVCEKDKAAVSRIIAELEEEGMVTRDSQGGSRYRAGLMLTAKGAAAAQAVLQTADLAVKQASKDIGEQEQVLFYSIMTKVAGNLHGICKDGLKKD
ncbi:MAG: MarR family transcriptional regulator [Oscillospiraceae bacterium]|nr:MarR family transcriptional regulator [Oscillospiraceae bacterium]